MTQEHLLLRLQAFRDFFLPLFKLLHFDDFRALFLFLPDFFLRDFLPLPFLDLLQYPLRFLEPFVHEHLLLRLQDLRDLFLPLFERLHLDLFFDLLVDLRRDFLPDFRRDFLPFLDLLQYPLRFFEPFVHEHLLLRLQALRDFFLPLFNVLHFDDFRALFLFLPDFLRDFLPFLDLLQYPLRFFEPFVHEHLLLRLQALRDFFLPLFKVLHLDDLFFDLRDFLRDLRDFLRDLRDFLRDLRDFLRDLRDLRDFLPFLDLLQ